MRLKRVEIVNFYSYRSFTVEVRDGLYNVWGLNGQGKTSLQLAIRLGLGWSPATRSQETLENAIHEDEQQCRIILVFDNSDNALRGYPEEVRTERHIIRGDARPRMKMTNLDGELVLRSQSDIRREFARVGYDPDDPGIFIEQGDLRSFYAVKSSSLLGKCIGLAGLRSTHRNVEQTKRAFGQIEDIRKEIHQTISDMEDSLEGYRPGHDVHIKFNEFDDELEQIGLEDKAIQYHMKRLKSQDAENSMLEIEESLEEYRNDSKLIKETVAKARRGQQEYAKNRDELEKERGDIERKLDELYREKYQKLTEEEELKDLVAKLRNRGLPSAEKAKQQVNQIQEESASLHSRLGNCQEELSKLESQMADMESGLALGMVPPREKVLKQKLVDAGIKTEFLVDCIDIIDGADDIRERLEILLDPFKFHLVIEKRNLKKAMEILGGEKEVPIIVPDDWPHSGQSSVSATEYLAIKKSAPSKLKDFLDHFILEGGKGFGPEEGAYLAPSIRFRRIDLSAYPGNSVSAIGKEGRRIAYESAKRQMKGLKNDIKNLTSDIGRLKRELVKAEEILDLARKKLLVARYEIELTSVRGEVVRIDEERKTALSNNGELERRIGELSRQIEEGRQLIGQQDLPGANKRVAECEKQYQEAKRKFDSLREEAELIEKDCSSRHIEKLDGFAERGLVKKLEENEIRVDEITESIEDLKKRFARAQARDDYNAYGSQESLIEEKKKALKKQQEHNSQLKEEWDKAQRTYEKMAKGIFSRANLVFREFYLRKNEGHYGQMTADFGSALPELDVRIKIGERRRMVPLNARVGGPSGGEQLAAVVNLIASILKARSQLAKADPDLYRPQPFICIDEPQQDMDDPAFRDAILNFKDVMEDTQIIILTHKPLPDPDLWQMWLFLHPELGTIGRSHLGEIHKLTGSGNAT